MFCNVEMSYLISVYVMAAMEFQLEYIAIKCFDIAHGDGQFPNVWKVSSVVPVPKDSLFTLLVCLIIE